MVPISQGARLYSRLRGGIFSCWRILCQGFLICTATAACRILLIRQLAPHQAHRRFRLHVPPQASRDPAPVFQVSEASSKLCEVSLPVAAASRLGVAPSALRG